MKHLVSLFFLLITFLGFSQQTENVDFKKVNSVIVFNQIAVDSTIFNSYEIKFDILKKTDSIFLDAVNMQFQNVALDEKCIKYRNDGKKLIIYDDFEASKSYKLNFLFFASPKKAMYFIDWDNADGNKQIWTQGQGKYTSNWLPSIDDMNDKIEFDLTYVAPKEYQVISNGKMVSKTENPTYNLWEFDMQKPMSSYLVALVIGKYDKKVEYSKSGIPLEMYYYPKDSLKFEPTYRYTKQMFDFLEEEIGVPYPWQNYKQVPVKDFLYAGMENTSTTIFADSYVIDSIAFIDKNYVNVNAHELAHQWFGDLVTETSGTHHWLQEGFATYYALLAERNVFGDDFYYWRLYEYAQELLEQDKAGGSTSLLNAKSSSTTFYKKGAWVLHILREKVGDKAFKNAVKNYLEKHQFKNVETNDFISEVENASGEDLSQFVNDWLKSKELLYNEMEKNLKSNSASIMQYLNYDCKKTPEACRLFLLNQSDSFCKEKIVESLGANISKSTFFTDDVKVRQVIAKSLSNIPSELKEDYESLLNDKSYITIEVALFNLWKNFPQERNKYLNKTKDAQGFNDKNVRTLWLTLALITEDFEPINKQKYFDELTSYTSPKYGFEIRQNAFQYLNQIQACNDVCKENLQKATKHHNWRFSKFAKDLLKVIQ
ncbi:aminopeptidase N [Flaviramulus basaltis]|uniref:Aminopeptidase N n=1 Tax=Flaviramulus basaltis TaxID=369401 RepID=A0A1K2IHS1_9FLAO|nr:M1 family metallopeptidase [Flaviramulus basaltis]SFZ91776.1 aminopeptidase N [Flaviramulus basaltis]